jgi:Uma2 family endonuclease
MEETRSMVTVVGDSEPVNVPAWVIDLESFRRWTETDDCPEKAHVWWLRDRLWIDCGGEDIFRHVAVKGEFAAVLDRLAESSPPGYFFGSGLLFTNVNANISGKPDGIFVSYKAISAGRVQFLPGTDGDYSELVGTPDVVLEVVSHTSAEKDNDVLRQAYWEANIPEYWLVDARKEPLKFDILRYTARGYVATRKQDGWVKSAVFGKSFKLTQGTNPLGQPDFKFVMR